MRKNLSIILPAAGIGRRIRSYGSKSLIDMGQGETLIRKQLRTLREVFPRVEIIVVVGFQAEQVIKEIPPGIKIVENERYEESGLTRSINMGLRTASHENVLLIHGDLLFNGSTVYSLTNGSSLMIVDTKKRFHDEEVGVNVDESKNVVDSLSYGMPIKWGQITYFVGKELEMLKKFAADRRSERFHSFELINSVIANGGCFKAVEPNLMKIVEIDSSKDVDLARRIFA